MLGVRAASDGLAGELVEFDQLVGRNLSIAEQVIMYIYLKIPVEPRVIYRPETRIKSLRMALYARADASTHSSAAHRGQTSVQCVRAGGKSGPPHASRVQETADEKKIDQERKRKSEIRVSGGRFVYETSDGLELSLPIAGFDNERVKSLFADWLLHYERIQNPNIDVLRNFRFSSLPEFDTLRQAMEFRNVDEWQLFRNKRGGVELRYFTTDGKDVVYVSGGDIESITRRL
jgi:hypothetical protein